MFSTFKKESIQIPKNISQDSLYTFLQIGHDGILLVENEVLQSPNSNPTKNRNTFQIVGNLEKK